MVPGGGAAASSAGGYAVSAVANGPATITTYTNVLPLAFYSAGGMIDFLTTPVTTGAVLQPLNTGVNSQQLVYLMSCSVQVSGVLTAVGDKRSAAVASATPPPTPAPVLTHTNCPIVAYANNGYGRDSGDRLCQ